MLLLFSLLPPPPFLAAFNKSIGVSSFCSILADDGMSTSFDFNSKSSISPPISSIFFPFSSFSSSLPKNPANFGGFGMFAKNPIFRLIRLNLFNVAYLFLSLSLYCRTNEFVQEEIFRSIGRPQTLNLSLSKNAQTRKSRRKEIKYSIKRKPLLLCLLLR